MKPQVIGITGRSGSGKTSLVQILLEMFGPNQLSVLSLDDYYKPRTKQKLDNEGYYNFDLPDSFDLNKFHADLTSLVRGEEISVPSYHYNSSELPEFKTITSASVVIVEGLFVNYSPMINDHIDYNVFIKLDQETSYNRRLTRDVNQRNYQQPEIKHRFFRHAEPAYQQHIEKYEALADCLLNSAFTFTSDPAFDKLVRHINRHIKK